ncbi:Aim25p [Ascoidea rubescens DSM 1968]|uniref:Phospholipid scramblase n=1 Tax=Ascoidea rubescens DSM 1968 TaxID=1344418 RepID=A0A1D2VHS4_9ASCO|nr:Scramblase-domain-containing protein [Ascoidea rubescens DSM 1968]ODV61204.1 Scramblase-domain-containing protein [Ascoidea rubescens DSM 1968]
MFKQLLKSEKSLLPSTPMKSLISTPKRFYSSRAPPPPPFRRIRRAPSREAPRVRIINPHNNKSYENQSYTIPKQPEVFVPEGKSATIKHSDPIATLLSQPTLVIERKIEMMNVFLGLEQPNKYVVMDVNGNPLAYMQERDLGILKAVMRQIYRLHRPFSVDVFDLQDNLLLTIQRPFSFINSHIKAILPNIQNPYCKNDQDGMIIGETIQSWHPWRRRYNLFLSEDSVGESFNQFGEIDARILSFDFPIKNEKNQIIGSVDRNWVGLGRELFTDTGVYILRMDPISFSGLPEDQYPNVSNEKLSLDQRAVLLANAISIDFDYFSRHSNANGMMSFQSYE